MMHRLMLELPEEVYEPLLQKAKEQGQPVEFVASAYLADSVQRTTNGNATPQSGAFLERWAGAFASGVTDAGLRHDDYIGESLAQDLREPKP